MDLKGALEELGLTAEIHEISAVQAKKQDLRDAVYWVEVEFDAIPVAAEKQFRELPKFPAVVRDVALVLGEDVPHAAVIAEIARNENKFLEKVLLFDIFRGGSIPAGRKSVAYSLTFRAADRTLTDAEVNAVHERIKRQLQVAIIGCEIRAS